MVVTTRATVRSWDDEHGWGVLDSAATPGGCWTHVSTVELDGYRSLTAGQQVELEAESPGQDGYPWRAVRVRADGGRTSRDDEAGAADESDAYSSELTIVWDDGSGPDAPYSGAK